MSKVDSRIKRKLSIRKRIHGTHERPRMSVFRSAKHIYVQVVDDDARKTLLSVSTLSTSVKKQVVNPDLAKKDFSKLVGTEIAKLCLEKGINKVVFDRNGFIYHGRISALADAARQAGLVF